MAQVARVQVSLPPKVKDLTGVAFNELTVKSFEELIKGKGAVWLCECQCGALTKVFAGDLKSGNTKSCGCRRKRLNKERSTRHSQTSGLSHKDYPRVYKIWRSMLNRCYTPSSSCYQNYGGRGVTVCDEWRHDFDRFYFDMGEPPEGWSLERVDVNKGYSKENCKWIPFSLQAQNRRDSVRVLLNGEEMVQAEAARRLGRHPSTLIDWRKGRTRKPSHINLIFIDQTITQ